MSEGLNKVMLIGNLGADPELRVTKNGTSVLNLRLAVNRRVKDGDQWKDAVEWVTVIVWEKRAEALSKLLRKGSRLYAEGRLATSSYEKDGEKRYKTEVVCDNVILLDAKRANADEAHGNEPNE